MAGKLAVVIVVFIALMLGGVGAWYYISGSQDDDDEKAEDEGTDDGGGDGGDETGGEQEDYYWDEYNQGKTYNWSEDMIELPKDTDVPYDENESWNEVMSFGIIQELSELDDPDFEPDYEDNDIEDPEEYYKQQKGRVYSELVQDNRFCDVHWEFVFNDNALDVRIDAYTGKILWVSNMNRYNGDLTLATATERASEILEELAPDVGDIEPSSAEAIVVYAEMTDEEGGMMVDSSGGDPSDEEYEDFDIVITGFTFYYYRHVDGINSTDRIWLDIDSAGNIDVFSKHWNTDIPDDRQPVLTEDEAIDIAGEAVFGIDEFTSSEAYLEDNSNMTIELFFWCPNIQPAVDGYREELYGINKAVLSWLVLFDEGSDDCYYMIWIVAVDAITGDIVGGYF